MNLYDYLLLSNHGGFLSSSSGSVPSFTNRNGGTARFTIMSNTSRFPNPIKDLSLVFTSQESLALHDFWHLHRQLNLDTLDYISKDNDLSYYIRCRSLKDNIFHSWVTEMVKYVEVHKGDCSWKEASVLKAEYSTQLWVSLAKDLGWESKVLKKLSESSDFKIEHPNRLTSELFLPVETLGESTADTLESPKSAFTDSSDSSLNTNIPTRASTRNRGVLRKIVSLGSMFNHRH